MTHKDDETADPVVTEAIASLARLQLKVRTRASDVTDLIVRRMTPVGVPKATVPRPHK